MGRSNDDVEANTAKASANDTPVEMSGDMAAADAAVRAKHAIMHNVPVGSPGQLPSELKSVANAPPGNQQNKNTEDREVGAIHVPGPSVAPETTVDAQEPVSSMEANNDTVSAPSLQRNTNVVQVGPTTGQPGAYDVRGLSGGETGSNLFEDDQLMDSSMRQEQALPAVEGTNNNDGLAVANPVEETDNQGDIEDARPVTPKDEATSEAALLEQRKQTNFMLTIGALCAIAIIIFVVIFFVVKGEQDSSPAHTTEEISGNFSTENPGNYSAITKDPTEILRDLLPDYTLNGVHQSRAFDWLSQDPNLATYSEKRLLQRFALATFYYSTNGETWGPDWLNITQHECDWEYFMPDNLQYHNGPGHRYQEYKYIDGPCVPIGYNSSTAPAGMEEPDDYLYLALVGQDLDGVIPEEITLLTSLKMIQFDETSLAGEIPTILAKLTGIRELHLLGADLTGTIPSELALLTELDTLAIGGTDKIHGTLPTEFGLLSNITSLYITETNVTGTIPLEYTTLHPLLFRLTFNQLTGTIPTEIGLMSTMEWLMLDNNKMTGTIPTEMGAIEKAVLLYLQQNHFTGTLPTELGLFTDIKQIYTYENLMTGSIPTELGQSTSTLWRLRVGTNYHTGTIPSELGKLTACHALGFRANMLSGTIPTEVAGMEAMEYFTGFGNQISGTMPMEFFSVNMKFFWMQNNLISGSIPSEIGLWSNASELIFDGNLLTGGLPTEIGTLNKLKTLSFGSNELKGEIPSEIGSLLKLKEFHAGSTALTGTVPTEFNLLATNGSLKILNLTDTDLSGALPGDICGWAGDHDLGNTLEFDCGRLCGCGCTCNDSSTTLVVIPSNDIVLESKGGSV